MHGHDIKKHRARSRDKIWGIWRSSWVGLTTSRMRAPRMRSQSKWRAITCSIWTLRSPSSTTEISRRRSGSSCFSTSCPPSVDISARWEKNMFRHFQPGIRFRGNVWSWSTEVGFSDHSLPITCRTLPRQVAVFWWTHLACQKEVLTVGWWCPKCGSGSLWAAGNSGFGPSEVRPPILQSSSKFRVVFNLFSCSRFRRILQIVRADRSAGHPFLHSILNYALAFFSCFQLLRSIVLLLQSKPPFFPFFFLLSCFYFLESFRFSGCPSSQFFSFPSFLNWFLELALHENPRLEKRKHFRESLFKTGK